jgi:hypothetical protein
MKWMRTEEFVSVDGSKARMSVQLLSYGRSELEVIVRGHNGI